MCLNCPRPSRPRRLPLRRNRLHSCSSRGCHSKLVCPCWLQLSSLVTWSTRPRCLHRCCNYQTLAATRIKVIYLHEPAHRQFGQLLIVIPVPPSLGGPLPVPGRLESVVVGFFVTRLTHPLFHANVRIGSEATHMKRGRAVRTSTFPAIHHRPASPPLLPLSIHYSFVLGRIDK